MKPSLLRRLFGLLASAICLFSSGCATITRGTKDTLVVETDPAGATVTLSNGMSGKTPTSFKLPRKENLVVTIDKEGYESLSINVNSQVSGAGAAGMAGNVLVGGLVGVIVDPLSGAMKDLRPNPVKATLVPLKKPDAASPPVAPSLPTPANATSPPGAAQPVTEE